MGRWDGEGRDRGLRRRNAGVTVRGVDSIREPISVREINATAQRAERKWARIREALRGEPTDTADEALTFGAKVSNRLGKLTSEERQALLFLFAIDRLTGRCNEPGVVDIDDDTAVQLVADRSDG